jgi:LysM repeat protein
MKMTGLSARGLLTVAVVTTATSVATAQDASTRYPITPDQRSTADQVAQAGVPLSALAPDAPERYTIKSGDTLWALSRMYLTSPWRWPELWGMNKDQIRNPHLIYPGQELRLVKEGGRARLELADSSSSSGPTGEGKLEPRIREQDGDRGAIRSIPTNLLEPFLSQPLVLDADSLADAPRVIATQEGRVYVGRGDEAYVRGIKNDAIVNYSAYRPLRPLYDTDEYPGQTPKDKGKPIGYEAFYLGSVNVVKPGEVAKVKVDVSKQEIGVGDRLLPVERQPVLFYIPKRPDQPVEARVISMYDGVRYAGGGQIVTLNRGSNEGLGIGDVLQLWRAGRTIEDRTAPGKQFVKLPDEQIGLGFVFRVFPGISYALVQRGTQPVELGDRASSPSDTLDLTTRPAAAETEADRVLRQPLRPLTIQ